VVGCRHLLAPLATISALSAAAFQQHPTPLRPADLAIAGISAWSSDSSAVRRLLGKPDSVADGGDPSESGEWPAWWYHDLEVLFFLDGRAVGTWIRGPSWATARGLHLGATRDEVVRLYGPPPESPHTKFMRVTGTPGPHPWDSLLVYGPIRRDGPALFVYTSGGLVSAIFAGFATD